MHGLSLAAASRAYSLVAVLGPLTVVASLVVEHELQGTQASVVVVHKLSCPAACGTLPTTKPTNQPKKKNSLLACSPQSFFRKGRGTRDQIANFCWIIEKTREF